MRELHSGVANCQRGASWSSRRPCRLARPCGFALRRAFAGALYSGENMKPGGLKRLRILARRRLP